VADITYIRLLEEFIFLAVVLDAFSRRVLGWELGQSLQTSLALGALEHTLTDRPVCAPVIHHSDQGVQYASADYVDRLREIGFEISMSRKGSPWENGRAESFLKTLKAEEVSLKQYRDLEQARRSIGYFLQDVYNQRRLHSALGYLPPAQFEAQFTDPRTKDAAAGVVAGSLSLPSGVDHPRPANGGTEKNP